MSYSRSYRETLVVRGSKTVEVPPSDRFTSVTIDFAEDVPVEVNIYVDTAPFDNSVDTCNRRITQLTGSVIETESAQIESVSRNSARIASSIIGGFFGYIRSELSQQVTELAQNIDANLMNLRELVQACAAKKVQMEVDYNRITNRYIKIFNDLNKEVTNRIFELDKPAFLFKKDMDRYNDRAAENDIVNTTTISWSENGNLQASISASTLKKRAFDTLRKTKTFLWTHKMMNTMIQKSMLNENHTGFKYAPICFLETKKGKKRISRKLFMPDYIPTLHDDRTSSNLKDQFLSTSGWETVPKEYAEQLNIYFKHELNKSYAVSDPHSVRVKDMIQQIAHLDAINIINLKPVVKI